VLDRRAGVGVLDQPRDPVRKGRAQLALAEVEPEFLRDVERIVEQARRAVSEASGGEDGLRDLGAHVLVEDLPCGSPTHSAAYADDLPHVLASRPPRDVELRPLMIARSGERTQRPPRRPVEPDPPGLQVWDLWTLARNPPPITGHVVLLPSASRTGRCAS
jgi:hypothetical protein